MVSVCQWRSGTLHVGVVLVSLHCTQRSVVLIPRRVSLSIVGVAMGYNREADIRQRKQILVLFFVGQPEKVYQHRKPGSRVR